VQALPSTVPCRALWVVTVARTEVPEALRPQGCPGAWHLFAGSTAPLCPLPADGGSIIVSGDGFLCPEAKCDAERRQRHHFPFVWCGGELAEAAERSHGRPEFVRGSPALFMERGDGFDQFPVHWADDGLDPLELLQYPDRCEKFSGATVRFRGADEAKHVVLQAFPGAGTRLSPDGDGEASQRISIVVSGVFRESVASCAVVGGGEVGSGRLPVPCDGLREGDGICSPYADSSITCNNCPGSAANPTPAGR
jgi:hypothetical protein